MNIKKLSLCIFFATTQVHAFTQWGAGGITPMGHEWLTRTSALEVLNAEHKTSVDPNDPRNTWTSGLAKNIDISTADDEVAKIKSHTNDNSLYAPRYDAVYSAIVGQRWVDLGGMNVANNLISQTGPDCFDAVSQEPADIQQDHFMRRYDDNGQQGGVKSAQRGQERFITHFINAAMATNKRIVVWDGGGSSAKTDVDYNYFLFGRAVHLFQDSFSPEHVVRSPSDNYEKVRQVKAYICTEGAEQHAHSTGAVLDYTSGDVIWKVGTKTDTGWGGYKASNMKPVALVAMEASKDLWAAFMRTMSVDINEREKYARNEAQVLIDKWMSFDKDEMEHWYDNENNRDNTYVKVDGDTGKGKLQKECMSGLSAKNRYGATIKPKTQKELVDVLDDSRRYCLFNIEAEPGYADANDPYLNIPFNWRWKSNSWLVPNASWQQKQLDRDTGKIIKIKEFTNNQELTVDSIENNYSIVTGAKKPLSLVRVPGDGGKSFYLRSKDNPYLFFSYSDKKNGRIKLWHSPNQAEFEILGSNNIFNLKNTYWNQYVWYDKNSKGAYLTEKGSPDNASSKWIISEEN
ncbi:hemolysin D [Aeromonas hydrophila]|uniref:hypothetical protein n=1 Tax=Aeromonas hydrophila TaxID=644 RepID=UPI001C5B9FAC|nr:hypothetical protein [Aeromonas hydrophila]MBW3795533.1 hemolysin D [Aeromonas hydrophila]MBW3802112.1 hemolysin D [Aeromonas hydrophila]MBW3818614.1 hemolysin D [Aeromonas hydrophila]